ncbi:MAG: hypothetical protein QXW52_09205 [Candidatus Caldarchaeum sp.]
MEVYDIRSIGFVADTTPSVITATVPDQMVGVIVNARYTIGSQSEEITVYLMQSRLGTVTGTLDAVTLDPSQRTIPTIMAVHPENVLAVVDPGHVVQAVTTTGSVIGVIHFRYAYGRMSRR